VLDKIRIDLTTLTELTTLTSFKDIEAEVINSTVVIYIHYNTTEDAKNAFRTISKYVNKIKEGVKNE